MPNLKPLQIIATPRTYGPQGETSSACLYAIAEDATGARSMWYLDENGGGWQPLPPILAPDTP